MKITRINKLRFRIFHDFVWPKGLHQFGRFNVIYGWNGSGKSTLASLFSFAERRAVLSDSDVELEIDTSTKIKGKDFASAQLPPVRVFNREYIDSTLMQTGGIAPIYFLGEDSVEKQLSIERLRKDLDDLNRSLGLADGDRVRAAAAVDDFCKDQARLIKEALLTANDITYNNYDKRKFRASIEAMNDQEASEAVLDSVKKAQLVSQKNAQPKPGIDRVSTVGVDICSLVNETLFLVGKSVVAQTLHELEGNSVLTKWVQDGLALHSGDHVSTVCRFCAKPFESSRRAALEAHFNDAFSSFQRELSSFVKKLKAAKSTLLALSLPDCSRFYEVLADEASSAQGRVLGARDEIVGILDELLEVIELKLEDIFASWVIDDFHDLPKSSISDLVGEFNRVIDKHNNISVEFKKEVIGACKRLERSYISGSYSHYKRLSDVVKEAEARSVGLKTRRSQLEREIQELERSIVEVRRPADELNYELSAYLGRDELRFDIKGSGYSLTRHGEPVSHLSEGERTAIAFLYFLKSLRDRGFDACNGVVVVDDPVSSLDDNAMFSAFGYMKDRTKDVGQLFVLTHSFSFFRLVKNWFHHLPGQKKKNVDDRMARFFMLRARSCANGSRVSQLEGMDPLLENYESEYQYLFKCVYDGAFCEDAVRLDRYYGMPNIARRLLEAFLAFRFPDKNIDLAPRFEFVEFDKAKKTRILRLLNTYSHAGAVSAPEHDLSLLAETQPVLRDILDMMKAVDGMHYEGLLKAIGAKASEEHGDS